RRPAATRGSGSSAAPARAGGGRSAHGTPAHRRHARRGAAARSSALTSSEVQTPISRKTNRPVLTRPVRGLNQYRTKRQEKLMVNRRQARSNPAERWVLLVTGLASFLVALDALVVSTALPAIRDELHASLGQLEWTINAYVLTFAVLLMTAAALGDRFGRRRLFAAGLALFAAASVACALAPNVGWLIAGRAVQGAGPAFVLPLALALLGAAFPPERRAWAIGVYASLTGLAVVAARSSAERSSRASPGPGSSGSTSRSHSASYRSRSSVSRRATA